MSDKIVGNIYQSTNYDQFTFFKNNRKIKVFKKLRDSLKEHGMICPVLVDRNMKVLDGQHRVQEARELEVPVTYVIVDVNADIVMREVNSTQRKWNPENWLTHHLDKTAYQEFSRMHASIQRQTKVSINILFAAIRGKELIACKEEWKSGQFTMSTKEREAFKETVPKLLDIFKVDAKLKSTKIVVELVSTINSDSYDHEDFLQTVKERGPAALEGFTKKSKVILLKRRKA